MEADETPTHVMLECMGVTDQREIYVGSPATIPEVLSNLGGMLGFSNELGWLEKRATAGNFYVQQAKRLRAETAQREEEEDFFTFED
ncbi:jg16347 [Pararge aegeria aegeria]|uniref:Jg16347 protein n=1 Tax=Pararge aegeria aegeria TaxID=348720 RepID=A0A8S4RTM2_9NEOP|nr:jg16347 [Pararge aegeria aegeria]